MCLWLSFYISKSAMGRAVMAVLTDCHLFVSSFSLLFVLSPAGRQFSLVLTYDWRDCIEFDDSVLDRHLFQSSPVCKDRSGYLGMELPSHGRHR